MRNHILTIDVGNSRVKYGLFSLTDEQSLPQCLEFTATEVGQDFPWVQLHEWTKDRGMFETRIAGANPRVVDYLIHEWPAGWLSPNVIQSAEQCQIECRVSNPKKVGIDRVLNALAANAYREDGSAAIVVDSGSATTVDCISDDGAFLGGAILPGFRLSSLALNQYTALLPLVSTRDLSSQDVGPIGRNTLEAIGSGLLWGQLGAVKEIVARQASELNAASVQVLVTGGGGPLLSPHLENSLHLPYLPMLGLILADG